ncbi:YdgA family protein [Deinococcus sp.]|uniref:YdgA family protein n=1 Tax=Deinococcus sp. TaxID=47478 RepID=UPI003CC64594
MTRAPETPPRSSSPVTRRWLIGGVAGLVLLGAAWAGGTLYASGQAQETSDSFAKTLDTALRSNKLGSVQRHVYQRGLTESTDDLYVQISGLPSSPLTGSGAGAPFVLHLRNHIQHGPLAGFQTLAQAVIDSEIVWDARTQAALDRAFGGRKPVIHTVVGLGGGTDTTVQIPAGQYAEQGVQGTWKALDGQVHVGDNGRSLSGSLVWPSASLGTAQASGSGGALQLSDLRYTVRQQPYLKALSQGESSFTLASLTLPQNLGDLQRLNVTTRTAPNGATLESRTRASLASLHAQGSTFTQMVLNLSATQFSSAALEDLIAVSQKPEYQQALQGASGLDAQTSQALYRALQPALSRLLGGNPRLAIDELSAQTPDGPLKVGLAAQVVDGQKIDLDALTAPAQQPGGKALGLLQNLRLSADIEGKQQLIAGLLGSSGNSTAQQLAQSIEPLIKQGMITRSGDLLRTHLEYSRDGATINGKRFQ